MMPAEAVEFGDVNEFARGSVRLGFVEHYFTFKAYRIRHE